MKKAGKLILKIFIALLLTVLILLSAFALGERIMFFSFYNNSERYTKIPALMSGYVPQGYCTVDGEDYRLSCGYMNDGSSSRIYIMPNDNSKAEFAEMKNADKTDYTGHTGGIAVMGDFVYVTAKTGCDIFSLEDILDGDGIATVKDTVSTLNDPAYCYIKDGYLYSGSFYRAGNYETPEAHRMTTPAGDKNMAVIGVYKLDTNSGKALSEIPDFVISTVGLAQGMAFIDGTKIAIATSYGLAKSHIYVYDTEKAHIDESGFEIDGSRVPLMYLDSDCLEADIVAPPMAEQIIYENGTIYIMNESASNKYLFGKLTSGSHVYGYKYE